MTTFTWTPDFGSSRETTPSVNQVKFGDGYEQRVTTGLNTMPSNYSLTFENRTQAERDSIVAFLEARAGTEAFNWTPIGQSTPKVFVCRKWTENFVKGTYFTISASFEQVFEP